MLSLRSDTIIQSEANNTEKKRYTGFNKIKREYNIFKTTDNIPKNKDKITYNDNIIKITENRNDYFKSYEMKFFNKFTRYKYYEDKNLTFTTKQYKNRANKKTKETISILRLSKGYLKIKYYNTKKEDLYILSYINNKYDKTMLNFNITLRVINNQIINIVSVCDEQNIELNDIVNKYFQDKKMNVDKDIYTNNIFYFYDKDLKNGKETIKIVKNNKDVIHILRDKNVENVVNINFSENINEEYININKNEFVISRKIIYSYNRIYYNDCYMYITKCEKTISYKNNIVFKGIYYNNEYNIEIDNLDENMCREYNKNYSINIPDKTVIIGNKEFNIREYFILNDLKSRYYYKLISSKNNLCIIYFDDNMKIYDETGIFGFLNNVCDNYYHSYDLEGNMIIELLQKEVEFLDKTPSSLILLSHNNQVKDNFYKNYTNGCSDIYRFRLTLNDSNTLLLINSKIKKSLIKLNSTNFSEEAFEEYIDENYDYDYYFREDREKIIEESINLMRDMMRVIRTELLENKNNNLKKLNINFNIEMIDKIDENSINNEEIKDLFRRMKKNMIKLAELGDDKLEIDNKFILELRDIRDLIYSKNIINPEIIYLLDYFTTYNNVKENNIDNSDDKDAGIDENKTDNNDDEDDDGKLDYDNEKINRLEGKENYVYFIRERKDEKNIGNLIQELKICGKEEFITCREHAKVENCISNTNRKIEDFFDKINSVNKNVNIEKKEPIKYYEFSDISNFIKENLSKKKIINVGEHKNNIPSYKFIFSLLNTFSFHKDDMIIKNLKKNNNKHMNTIISTKKILNFNDFYDSFVYNMNINSGEKYDYENKIIEIKNIYDDNSDLKQEIKEYIISYVKKQPTNNEDNKESNNKKNNIDEKNNTVHRITTYDKDNVIANSINLEDGVKFASKVYGNNNNISNNYGYKLARYYTGRNNSYESCIVTLKLFKTSRIVGGIYKMKKFRTDYCKVIKINRFNIINNNIILDDELVKEDCNICYSNIANTISLTCRHKLCKKCWDDVKKIDDKCPFCRIKITKIVDLPENKMVNRTNDSKITEAFSCININEIKYIVDNDIRILDYNPNPNIECSNGIHYYNCINDILENNLLEYNDIPDEIKIYQNVIRNINNIINNDQKKDNINEANNLDLRNILLANEEKKVIDNNRDEKINLNNKMSPEKIKENKIISEKIDINKSAAIPKIIDSVEIKMNNNDKKEIGTKNNSDEKSDNKNNLSENNIMDIKDNKEVKKK